ncbi:GNAT family N-acetyltransferase [Roseibium aggregatum]|uniref:GNAT family N-acetyltransferase n=1 Tax=Roseibium aggregatum TaxID=187304 RepID=UPI001AD927F7|nr:GNAT family N-acetyltransferase [Roseibium aggregatum]
MTEIAPDILVTHMSDPRVAEHMPLLTFRWDRDIALEFIEAKEKCWHRDGLGHWAFLADDRYVGWGGFQLEDGDWDFGLVLRPDCFGLGSAIAKKALEFARADERIPYVTFLLPPSRKKLGALRKLGAAFVTETDYNGEKFLKFRLET